MMKKMMMIMMEGIWMRMELGKMKKKGMWIMEIDVINIMMDYMRLNMIGEKKMEKKEIGGYEYLIEIKI